MTYAMRQKLEIAINSKKTTAKEITKLLREAYTTEDRIGKEIIETNISQCDLLYGNIIS